MRPLVPRRAVRRHADTEAILRTLLGYEAGRIAALTARGAFGPAGSTRGS